ncbi:MAG: hypothetical protein DKT66_05690 [Candidatus Melainabacteria bacterium]|nr:MAG: hypothetical protein DKT66_05690 [Candidatus Melainabacteria bacterium]
MENADKDLDYRKIADSRGLSKLPYSSYLNDTLDAWKKRLVDSFKGMSRKRQERLIEKNAVVLSVGTTVTFLNLIYRALPLLIRVFCIPAAVVGSYVFAKKCIAPFVISELKEHLNPEILDEEEADSLATHEKAESAKIQQ